MREGKAVGRKERRKGEGREKHGGQEGRKDY